MPRKSKKFQDPTQVPEITTTQATTTPPTVAETSQTVAVDALANAMIRAINATKGPEKKNAVNRKPNTPWTPKDGSAKLKLKRKLYQHGIPVDEDTLDNPTVESANKLRPGTFLEGWVKVVRRRDKGIDVDYPFKTASQRLKLVNQFGIRNFKELLDRCIYESENPTQFAVKDWDE